MTTTTTSGAADLPEALINIAREIEALKRDCGMDPESAIAIQNGRYMAISYKVRALAAGQATAEPENIRGILARCRDFIDTTKAPAYPAGADLADEIDVLLAAPTAQADTNTASGAADKVLAYLDDLSDDAAAHIFPSDLAKCMTSECVVEVVSVRAGNPNERTVPLFSREQVVAALASTPAQPVAEPADTVVLNAAMRAIQQAIELIGAPTDERMRAVRRVLRGAVIVAEDDGKVAPLPSAAYAALPESFLEIPDVQDESGINAYYSREAVLECIDAALASHGQAYPTIGDLCARIKAADDAAADRDYMLDSNDCIAVLRGEWKGPLTMDKPERASHGQAPAQPDPAYSEACNLATALFKKHFAHLPDYASGQVVWGLFDSTEGVILQIDNMVSGLVQPPTTSPQADSVLYDPKAVLDVFNSARAGSDKSSGYLRGILAVIAHWESRPEPHRWMVPVQADSVQEDAARKQGASQ